MSERLMIEETTVYEIDLECLRRKQGREGSQKAEAREEAPSSFASTSPIPSKKEPAR